ncbi:MAG: tRNA pseudouridine(38-40) synthase TruA [Saprospiraceae bacterium]|nr:tRNA pseudouridine(38-40) synthase TruA [Saprospiraceae bacterium]
MKNRYFIQLSYNGANYHGWQLQDNSISVQQVLNEAISLLLNSNISITGVGRTDTGVHAKEFYAHFDYENINEEQSKQLVYKLNKFLPNDISIKKIVPVKNDANARFDAISRTYKYYISLNKNPFFDLLSYYLYGELDVDKMNEAAKVLFDYNDFTSFSKTGTQVKTNNCKIYHAAWEQNDEMLVFTIKADRFLRNMVRAIVGTLLDIGRGKIDILEFRNIIESKNRSDAGYSVPAKALFLTKIEYPDSIFL